MRLWGNMGKSSQTFSIRRRYYADHRTYNRPRLQGHMVCVRVRGRIETKLVGTLADPIANAAALCVMLEAKKGRHFWDLGDRQGRLIDKLET